MHFSIVLLKSFGALFSVFLGFIGYGMCSEAFSMLAGQI